MVYTVPKICKEIEEFNSCLILHLNQQIDNEEVARNLRYKRLKEFLCPTTQVEPNAN